MERVVAIRRGREKKSAFVVGGGVESGGVGVVDQSDLGFGNGASYGVDDTSADGWNGRAIGIGDTGVGAGGDEVEERDVKCHHTDELRSIGHELVLSAALVKSLSKPMVAQTGMGSFDSFGWRLTSLRMTGYIQVLFVLGLYVASSCDADHLVIRQSSQNPQIPPSRRTNATTMRDQRMKV